jgi:hypothetical protein
MHFSMAMACLALFPAHVSRESALGKRGLRLVCFLRGSKESVRRDRRLACAAVLAQNRPLENPKISLRAAAFGPLVTIWKPMKVTKWSIFSGDLSRERTTG